jgi:hypothetical protein
MFCWMTVLVVGIHSNVLAPSVAFAQVKYISPHWDSAPMDQVMARDTFRRLRAKTVRLNMVKSS